MQLQIEKLGKVSITVEEGYWDIAKDYDKLTVVEKEGTFGTYISRKPVPAGTVLTDRTYWIPFSSLKEEIILNFNKWVSDYGALLGSQAETLNTIQEAINSIYSHLPQGVIFKGNIDSVRAGFESEVILEGKTTNEEDANFILYKNNEEIYRQEEGNSFNISDTVNEDTEYKLVTIQNGYKYISTWNIAIALPLYAGGGQTYQDAIGDDKIVKISSDISGIYSIVIDKDGDYIFFVAPKGYLIKSIKMNGLDVPIKSTKEVYLGTDYIIYQSDYQYKAGTYPIQINNYTGLNEDDFLGILNSLGDTASAVDVANLKERIDNLPVNELIDKEYAPDKFSGMGRIYLRKNIKNGKNILEQNMMLKSNTIYIIQYDFDLNEQEIVVPENCVLKFEGGSLSNGTINFNNTNIVSNYKIFYNITADGTLINVNIEWFDIKYNDSSKDNFDILNMILKLTGKAKYKRLVLQKDSIIYVDASPSKEWNNIKNDEGIMILSNVDLDLNNSTIIVLPNSFKSYNLFLALNTDNIKISNGTLIGDANTHIGTTGEWGYGISLRGSHNFIIENVVCRDFWGDGINIQVYEDAPADESDANFIKYHCGNGYINNVKCIHNGRQGMSVEGCLGLIIENSEFSGTYRTSPMSGIDFEPYTFGNKVRDVEINNCIINNNANSGIIINCSYDTNLKCNIENINIKNCNNTHVSISGEGISINDCNISHNLFKVAKNINFNNCALKSLHIDRCNYIRVNYNNCKFSVIEAYSALEDAASEDSISNFNFCTFDYTNSIITGSNILTRFNDVPSMQYNFNNCSIFGNPNENLRFILNHNVALYNCKLSDISVEYNVLPLEGKSRNLILKNCEFNNIITTDIWAGGLINIVNNTDSPKHFDRIDIANLKVNSVRSDASAILALYGESATADNIEAKNIDLPYYFKLKSAILSSDNIIYSLKGLNSFNKNPNIETQINIGFQYFNTTLNKPIWWTGSKWVDATGADV